MKINKERLEEILYVSKHLQSDSPVSQYMFISKNQIITVGELRELINYYLKGEK